MFFSTIHWNPKDEILLDQLLSTLFLENPVAQMGSRMRSARDFDYGWKKKFLSAPFALEALILKLRGVR